MVQFFPSIIGLDPSGYLLSKEVFGNAVFYLDTNVIINALEPKAQHFKSFEVLSKACRQLRIELKICQISKEQLQRVVEWNRGVISKVVDRIP